MTDYSTGFFPLRASTNTLGPSITAHYLGQEGVIRFSVMNNQSTELIANLHEIENLVSF